MALSRKRRKELKRLTKQADQLWNDQRQLLDHASVVVKDARQQAANFAREDLAPRVRHTIDGQVKPAISNSVLGARTAALNTRNKVVGEVIPGVSGAIGSALAAVEVAKNQQLRDAIARVSKISNEVGTKVGLVQPKPKTGVGTYIAIGLGVVAAVVVAYAAWQTLRADDDLWIEDEQDAAPLDVPTP